MKKAWKVISSVIFGIIIALEVLLIGMSVTSRIMDKNPSVFGYSMYVVATGSMSGALEVNDVIIGKKVDVSTIIVGDIITYIGSEEQGASYKNRSITHRVIEKRQVGETYYFVTKGDANNDPDPEIKGSQIETKFVYKTVIVTFFYNVLNTWYGFTLLIVVPIGYIIVNRIITIVVEIKEDKKNGKAKKDSKE